MKISVVGTGYVGLVTGTCFAETGNYVTCIDIDEEKVNTLRQGQVPIYEPGLDVLFERNQREGRLTFTTDLANGIKSSSVIFLALPTPPNEDGSADLNYVIDVAKQLGSLISEYTIIVNKSTVPVGTTEMVRNAISEKTHIEFDVVSNPEFLREGVAVDDFMKPDRVVIGTSSERAAEIMKELYAPLVRQGNPVLIMDEKSAEMTKYAANSFLATKITFMNEVANLCEILGADVDMVRKGIGTDNRIGKRFLFAGIGYGGSCFPKDVQALAKTAAQANYDFKILNSVMSVNEKQKTKLIQKIKSYFNYDLKGKTFAVWGLAFKPYTDDIREAPSLANIRELIREGAHIKAYDPEAAENVKKLSIPELMICEDEYEALRDADALLIVTEWPVFRTPEFGRMKQLLNNDVIFDGRNLYDLDTMRKYGFNYISIGRKEIHE
jgi:UDPglucose 6-dehydrogenase